MTTRWARFARGWLAAVFATLVAACSHSLAGGMPPSGLALLLAFAFSGLVCIAFAGKTLSKLRLSIAVGLSQFMFHGVFSLIAPPADVAMPTIAGHDHTGAMMVAQLHDLAAADANVAMPMAQSGWMWFAHGIAAVVTIVAFRYGERAYWGLLETTRLAISRLFPRIPLPQSLPEARASVVAVDRASLPARLDVILPALGHRGPPAFAAQF